MFAASSSKTKYSGIFSALPATIFAEILCDMEEK